MRGSDMRTGELFSYVDLEERVPRNHPLRLIRRVINEVLTTLDREFAELYAAEGRPSIAPERLLRALLLQAFYTIRSERQLMEQLHYNLLYRWFVGLGVDDPVWVPTVFTKNRDRLLDAEVARKFLAELLGHKEVCALLSDEHFSVDGTQVQAWASMKSFVANDGSSGIAGTPRQVEGTREHHLVVEIGGRSIAQRRLPGRVRREIGDRHAVHDHPDTFRHGFDARWPGVVPDGLLTRPRDDPIDWTGARSSIR